MNIVVVGQGAIGQLWYHKLKQQLNNVSLLCSKNVTDFPAHLTLIEQSGQQQTCELKFATPESLSNADLVLFCLKAYHYQQAFIDYIPYIKLTTPIILCHNGMLNQQLLPQQHILLTLLTTHGCKKLKDFSVEHTGAGQNDLGLAQGSLTQQQIDNIVSTLDTALPVTCWHENITEKQWLKLAINCVINPLTAINNCLNGHLLAPEFDLVIDEILTEVLNLAKHQGIDFSFEQVKARVLAVAKSTETNSSSMRSDILYGRKTEIAQINGYIHQLGKRCHISTPINTQLFHQVSQLASTAHQDGR